MPPASTTDVIATIVFWVVMLPIAGYIFQYVCGMCGADLPTFRRSVLITTLVGAAAYFTFDGLGYGIVIASRDTTNLNLPPGYNYGNWLREPLYLKWQVMGLIPLLRWLPVLFAVCLAATAYVFLLAEPFRNCIAILAIQWTVNVVAMALLAFALSNILRFVAPSTPASSAPEAAQGSGFAPASPEARAATRPNLRRSERGPPREMADKKPDAEDHAEAGPDLKSVLAAHEGAAGSSWSQLREQLHALDERLGPYIEPIKTAAAPYTKYLPPAVQEFLDDGGWWLVLAALALAVGFWLRALWRRLRRAVSHKRRHHGKRRPHEKASPLAIDLDLISDAFTDPGPHQITVRRQPGRLRLVVMAPSPNYVGDLAPEMAESLLDWLQPGLGESIDADSPRLVVWPRHPSLGHFTPLFHKLVQIPEAKGRRSPWVLISGPAHMGRQTVFLGLAVFLDRTTYQREIEVAREKWNEVIGLQKVAETV
jgi:hypothetical protein